VKKNHFKILGVPRRKNDRKHDENARKRTREAASGIPTPDPCALTLGTTVATAQGACPHVTLRPGAARFDFLLIFQAGSVQKAQFSYLKS